MSLPDLPLDELRSYQPRLASPADAAGFWAGTLADAARFPVAATFERVATGLRLVDTFDVCFAGYGGHPIRGWLHLPASQAGPLPCVVQYIGYGGGRGLAHENVFWAVAGYAHFIMDTRGQGAAGSVGDTPDPEPAGPSHPGFMTRGILDPATYYYRRLYVDAVRAVDAARVAGHFGNAESRLVEHRQAAGGRGLQVYGVGPDAHSPDHPHARVDGLDEFAREPLQRHHQAAGSRGGGLYPGGSRDVRDPDGRIAPEVRGDGVRRMQGARGHHDGAGIWAPRNHAQVHGLAVGAMPPIFSHQLTVYRLWCRYDRGA